MATDVCVSWAMLGFLLSELIVWIDDIEVRRSSWLGGASLDQFMYCTSMYNCQLC